MVEERFQQAIALFNRREFFACHDVLEEIWTETIGPERDFFQGLIHAAVSLFHFSEGNLGGARKMHDSTKRYLEPFEPEHRGINLSKFLSQFDRCFEPLLGSHEKYPTGVELDETLIPELHVTN